MFEGVPTYPDACQPLLAGRRQAQGQHLLHRAHRHPRPDARRRGAVKKTSRSSLRILGTVGEPINPEAWEWYLPRGRRRALPDRRHLVADRDRRHLITPLPGARPLKPGSATLPFFGVEPAPGRRGTAARSRAPPSPATWSSPGPGRARCAPSTATTSASSRPTSATTPGYYFTGDGAAATRTATTGSPGASTTCSTSPATAWAPPRVESALVLHDKVAEAAVVGYPHDIKGQGIYAYVTPWPARSRRRAEEGAGQAGARKEIGPIASPDIIQWAPGLPKTRSGKIMRRILRKIAANEIDARRYLDTLADPAVVDDLIANHPPRRNPAPASHGARQSRGSRPSTPCRRRSPRPRRERQPPGIPRGRMPRP
jgi:acetyl-CoA synthetase